jgi:photosystem II stability/assembly factor-like uncharacterized protein
MKKLFFLIIIHYSLFIIHCFSQWSVVSNQGNQAVNFPSENVGYSTANGITRKTTNGGVNWASLSGGNLTGIFFINDLTGWVVGYPGYIGKTTNGSSFVQQPTGIQDRLNDVFFINDNTGWICGGDFGTEIMFRTTNAGTNWLPISSGLPNKMFSIYFIDVNTGWCVGGPSAPKIIKSTNGGMNWTLQPSPAATPLYSVHFVDANTGWAVAGYLGGETIINTTNGGNTWVSQTSGDSRYLRECFAINSSICFAVGQGGKIIKTTNGGANWLVQASATTQELWAIDFVNDTVGYAVGSSVVVKTTNGGVTFIGNEGGTVPRNHKLYQNYPNPFNPVTTITFELSNPANTGITVFDLNGKELFNAFTKILSAGQHETTIDMSKFPSGVYFYSLTVNDDFVDARKMMLVK